MRNFWLDTILIALFIAELSFQHLPKILHEILGVALTVAVLAHLSINRRRLAMLTKKISPRKIFSLTIDFALTICAAITLISGVCMSNHLFAEIVSFELRRNMTLHQLHVALPYVLMILIGVHVGLHWQELQPRLLKFFGAKELHKRRRNFFPAIIAMLTTLGTAGLFLNRVGDRIAMKHIFATPATELPAIIFALMTLGGIVLFALITVTVDKIFRT